MFRLILKHKHIIILGVMILAYIIYFSWFTLMRYRTLHASYFDLGIMHQTVYNSFIAIKTGDWSRFLELTNPHGFEQVKRMAIHNDIILGLIALFYFIYSGPETLLALQTIILALGAIPVYLIAQNIINKNKNNSFIPILLSFSYLMYTPMQRANIFDFHAVTIATTTLLFMFYFWLVKKYWLSGLFLIISLLTKEQVALTTAFFGMYVLLKNCKLCLDSHLRGNDIRKNHAKFSRDHIVRLLKNKNIMFGILVILISLIWFIVSMKVVVPYFRGSAHFALERYGDFGVNLIKYIWHVDTARYFWFLLGPLGFLSLLSPALLVITIPEFAINLLSNSWNMRNIIYHYTAVVQPWIFIAAIYGIKKLVTCNLKLETLILFIIIFSTLLFSYFKGPLPFSREAEINLGNYKIAEKSDIDNWVSQLKNDQIKVSATGNLSPFFTSRRYFYNFSKYYYLADYIIIRPNEIFDYADKKILTPIYRQLQSDTRFKIIYKNNNFEIYRKVTSRGDFYNRPILF